MSEQHVYDLVIIGAGPAGLSAAIYAKRAMLDSARESYLMADSSKFGTRAFSQIDRLHDRYRVITDSGIDKANLARLKDITENITIVG